ncbi:hypothetical protein AHAS_Ahas20G0232100 [Arachis hypogaea]
MVKVKIIPEVRCCKTSKAIIAELVRVHKNTEFGMRLPVYDGGRNIYTAAMLPFTYKEFTILLIEDDESIGTTREREFNVVIKFAARVSMHQLRELLSGKQVDTPQEALTIIDIVRGSLQHRGENLEFLCLLVLSFITCSCVSHAIIILHI